MMRKKNKSGKKVGPANHGGFATGKKVLLDEQLQNDVERIRGLLLTDKEEQVYAEIKHNPQFLAAVTELLFDENPKIREKAAMILGNAAAEGEDISEAVPNLVSAFEDTRIIAEITEWALRHAMVNEKSKDIVFKSLTGALEKFTSTERTRNYATRALGFIANHIDITKALPALVTVLTDGRLSIRGNVFQALSNAINNERSKCAAIKILVDALGNKHYAIRTNVVWALQYAAKYENRETRELIVKRIMDFTNSDWFTVEKEKNSVAFVNAVNGMEKVVNAANEPEKEVAL